MSMKQIAELQYRKLTVPVMKLMGENRYTAPVVCLTTLPPKLAADFDKYLTGSQVPASACGSDCAYLHDFERFMEKHLPGHIERGIRQTEI